MEGNMDGAAGGVDESYLQRETYWKRSRNKVVAGPTGYTVSKGELRRPPSIGL
jgi:hypothetical protein